MAQRPKHLLDQVRDALRLRHYSLRAENCYVAWTRHYILSHNQRHPLDMSSAEIAAILTHLAVNEKVAASTQNRAFSALLFLYRGVLRKDLEFPIDSIRSIRAKNPQRLPTVLTKEVVRKVIGCMSGTHRLMASMIYGMGWSNV